MLKRRILPLILMAFATIPAGAAEASSGEKALQARGKELFSQYMPPFGQELSEQNISDLITFIKNVSLTQNAPHAPEPN